VREVANDEPVEPNHVYIIPPDASLTISDAILKLRPRHSARPNRSIDAFFLNHWHRIGMGGLSV
jgi:two-component system CheB/CheR fusion protein